MNEQETIVDIIAEKRRLAEHIRNNLSTVPVRQWDQQAEIKSLEDEADRLEAALERERGDAAKLREVCEKMLDLLTAEGFEDGGMSIELDEKQVIMWRTRFRAALAAPARNCDIAQDWLRDLYVKFKPPASVKREMPPEWVDAVMSFCRWLVATAQVGGAT